MAKYCIAVVDDEPSITKLLKLDLKDNFDCEVEVFNDSNMAYSKFKEKKFDAIILDHRMPGLTGMEIVKRLRSSQDVNAKTRILLLTGHIDEAESYDENLLDEVIFLQKPTQEGRIVRWISFMLKSQKKVA